MYFFAHPES